MSKGPESGAILICLVCELLRKRQIFSSENFDYIELLIVSYFGFNP